MPLTEEIVKVFGNVAGEETIIKVLIDIGRKKIILVPKEKHHLQHTAYLLKVSIDDIYHNPGLAKEYIGADIFVKEGFVVGVLTGWSGLVQGALVKHSPRDLQVAHGLIWEFINEKGSIPVADRLEVNKITFF